MLTAAPRAAVVVVAAVVAASVGTVTGCGGSDEPQTPRAYRDDVAEVATEVRRRYATLQLDGETSLRPFLEGLPALVSDWRERVTELDPPPELQPLDAELVGALTELEAQVRAVDPDVDLTKPEEAAAIGFLVGPDGAAVRVERAMTSIDATAITP